MDVIIPYDGQSETIIFALRSIEKYFPCDKVYLVTSKTSGWMNQDNLIVLFHPDYHLANKDANLFDKVLYALRAGAGEEFMFWSDDQILIDNWTPIPVRNSRPPCQIEESCKWQRRMKRTGMFIKEKMGYEMPHNYDSHVPQPMKKALFEKIRNIDYQSGLGYCINTLYFGLAGCPQSILQGDVKATFECNQSFKEDLIVGKKWIGFSNSGYTPGLKSFLEKKFNKKSKFEK